MIQDNNFKDIKCLNALTLKIIACIAMLLDHMYFTVVSEGMWMTIVGRVAFPIFAFQITEGFFHTKNVKKYALRLFVFAVISEIPFNFMKGGSWIFPYAQNVMWTLLIGLLVIWAVDKPFQALIHAKNLTERSKGMVRLVIVGFFAITLGCMASLIGLTDYHYVGVLTVVMFYLFRGNFLLQLLGMVVVNNMLGGQELVFTLFGHEQSFSIQLFALLAMIPIGLYNGEKGYSGRGVSLAFYAFYPVHMLLLSLPRLMY